MRPPAKASKAVRNKRLEEIAYHEAGHAVVGWKSGLKVRRVTIEPDAEDRTLGHVLYARARGFRPDIRLDDRARCRAERHIVCSFAGQLAHAKFLGRRGWGMEQDDREAVGYGLYLRCTSTEAREAYLHYCFLTARDLVKTQWRGIQAVARALLQRSTLTGSEVIEVLSPGSAALRERLRAAAQKKGRASRHQDPA